MPRISRINAPGALHHVIARGINRQQIFLDDADRKRFAAQTQRAFISEPVQIDSLPGGQLPAGTGPFTC
jgi:hypothetical protein